jgi:hypothetical protein
MNTSSSEHLSPHFTLGELTKSVQALRLGIDNTPDEQALKNLCAICLNILEPVREHFGIPFTPSSGYRSPAVNEAIGSKPTSQHRLGQAADFEVPGIPNLKLAEWIRDNLEFDQLILEFHTSGDPNSGWVHCSYRSDGQNRKQCKTTQDGENFLPGLIG